VAASQSIPNVKQMFPRVYRPRITCYRVLHIQFIVHAV